MIIVGKEELNKFAKKHPQSKKPLASWLMLLGRSTYSDFNQLRLTFPSADYVYHTYTIFNISGNKYRLISIIDYNAQIISIRQLWTHATYSMSKNQGMLKRGDL